mmetsp:Transcript_35966/g.90830  ORF Transcript_35966/g.90830 Transcript_35966/m.90830 type:complete len:201 (-) Transcript_35966:468-1070(-)
MSCSRCHVRVRADAPGLGNAELSSPAATKLSHGPMSDMGRSGSAVLDLRAQKVVKEPASRPLLRTPPVSYTRVPRPRSRSVHSTWYVCAVWWSRFRLTPVPLVNAMPRTNHSIAMSWMKGCATRKEVTSVSVADLDTVTAWCPAYTDVRAAVAVNRMLENVQKCTPGVIIPRSGFMKSRSLAQQLATSWNWRPLKPSSLK